MSTTFTHMLKSNPPMWAAYKEHIEQRLVVAKEKKQQQALVVAQDPSRRDSFILINGEIQALENILMEILC